MFVISAVIRLQSLTILLKFSFFKQRKVVALTMAPPHKPSRQDWDLCKSTIRKLYLFEDYGLDKLAHILHSHGLRVT
jgi:hypothetical protein